MFLGTHIRMHLADTIFAPHSDFKERTDEKDL